MSDLGILTQTSGRSLTADSGPDWLSSSWWEQLQPGSWRGVGFVLDMAEAKTGRRIALHEYPYRDTIWAEDLGKLPRRFSFQAFIVGDDVYQQRDAMVKACEQAGPGTLVHPTFGSVECVLLDFAATDRRDRGRYIELTFQFVVAGDLLFPQAIASTGDQVNGAADRLIAASAADLGTLAAVPTTATKGMAAAPAARSTVGATQAAPSIAAAAWGDIAIAAVNDPARALGAVAGLQGFYGRYAAGRRGTVLPATATVASVLDDATSSRAAVLEAVDALNTAMGAF